MYRLYSDASFSTPVPQEPWHGLQGPLLAAEVGDILTVVLKVGLLCEVVPGLCPATRSSLALPLSALSSTLPDV
jgi:hypothetical protein